MNSEILICLKKLIKIHKKILSYKLFKNLNPSNCCYYLFICSLNLVLISHFSQFL